MNKKLLALLGCTGVSLLVSDQAQARYLLEDDNYYPNDTVRRNSLLTYEMIELENFNKSNGSCSNGSCSGSNGSCR